MKNLGVALLSLALVPGSAFACRDAEGTHEQRMKVADIAFLARVSGVHSPWLENQKDPDTEDVLQSLYEPRTVRLVVTEALKGHPPRVIEVTVENCDGSTYAEVGAAVYVFKISGHWRLDPAPKRAP